MRILNVIHSVNPVQGGPGEGLRQMVQATRRLGHRQEVLTLDGCGDAWVNAFPGPIHAIGPVRTTYAFNRGLVPWLMAHGSDYDALIVHGLWQYHGLAVRQAARELGLPYFIYLHGMLDPWFKRHYPFKHLKKWLYWPWADYRVTRDAQAVLFTTEEERRLARESFWLYRVRERVVGYGLALNPDAQCARAEDFVREHPKARGARILLFLGRLHVKKGCDLLIDAFAQVAAQDPSLLLVMAGPDQAGLRASLERQAVRLGIAGRILWTGMLQGATKWAAMRAAEAFVLPSHQENFGIAVAEALAVGAPVLISTKVNIWREVVDAGAGLAEPDTHEGTLRLLQRWLALDARERAVFAANAAPCFETHFHVDSAARRLTAALESEVVGPWRARPIGAPACGLPLDTNSFP